MVDRIFRSALHCPVQRGSGDGGHHESTTVDAGLDLRSFFIVVPGGNLQGFQLMVWGEELHGLLECSKPGLAALLMDLAIAAKRRLRVVESFEGRAGCRATCGLR